MAHGAFLKEQGQAQGFSGYQKLRSGTPTWVVEAHSEVIAAVHVGRRGT